MHMPDPKVGCHRTGFKQKCRKLVTDGVCDRWVVLEGADPVNGQPFTKGNCLDNWTMTLQLDLARKMQNGFDGNQKATESFRNVMVQLNHPELYEQIQTNPKLIK